MARRMIISPRMPKAVPHSPPSFPVLHAISDGTANKGAVFDEGAAGGGMDLARKLIHRVTRLRFGKVKHGIVNHTTTKAREAIT